MLRAMRPQINVHQIGGCNGIRGGLCASAGDIAVGLNSKRLDFPAEIARQESGRQRASAYIALAYENDVALLAFRAGKRFAQKMLISAPHTRLCSWQHCG